ncbi:aldose 1-epimerase family protein [Solicola gregarius]|uniref:Aldose 1-epimerase family protein n=1 Tax=Solicola gregarius TaxID=2908642 RepID=A0AA46YNG8_9ACTN|nr:aldose 1-epimerase family protein [Solicola gregarius]UYM07604.1 aldose 1-epimerase family protein [Solicola gregarius]
MIGLASGPYAATVNPLGGGLATLTYDGSDLIVPQHGESGTPRFRGAVLAPWSNRIGDGRYRFANTDHQLSITEPERDNALHGLVLDEPWTIADRSDSTATLRLRVGPVTGYPFLLDLTLTYALADDGLTVTLDASNAGDSAAPYGCGFHPYVCPGTDPVDAATLRFEAAERLRTDPVRLLPTGREPTPGTPYDFGAGLPIGTRELDDAFTQLSHDTDGRHHLHVGRVAVWWDAAMPWVQLFTPPDRASIAVEPCTSPPDAFRSGDDLVVVEPGSSHRVTWGLQAVD